MEFIIKVNESEIQLIAAGLVSLANSLNAKLQAQINEQLAAQQKSPDLTLVQNEEQKEKIS